MTLAELALGSSEPRNRRPVNVLSRIESIVGWEEGFGPSTF